MLPWQRRLQTILRQAERWHRLRVRGPKGPTSEGRVWIRQGAPRPHPLGQCQLFSQLKIAPGTAHTYRSNCNHSVCCLSLLFYFCLHFSVSVLSGGCRLGIGQSAGDRLLAESELCSQQFIENISQFCFFLEINQKT